MSGFRKAKPQQAALKVGFYGPPGSGKTLTTLMCAEGLAAITGKRIAYVDTERGTDFYAQQVKERGVHPEAFDFDALYTRSLMETDKAVRSLDPAVHGIVVIDSITHLWEAAREAFNGKMTKVGTIPFHAWAKIKKPYKDLMAVLLSSPLHVFILGRQGNEFEEDEETGETKKVGVKMKAEGETPYEPHILIRMEGQRLKNGTIINVAIAEKDRTGILSGREFRSPTFESLIKPLLPLLGDTQAKVESTEDVAEQDAAAIEEAEATKQTASTALLRKFHAKIMGCEHCADLTAIGKEITPEVKKQMTTADVATLRGLYAEADKHLC